MKFKVGMKLAVRDDLNSDMDSICESGVANEMISHRGEEVTVSRVIDRNKVSIFEDDETYTWNKNMFKEFL